MRLDKRRCTYLNSNAKIVRLIRIQLGWAIRQLCRITYSYDQSLDLLSIGIAAGTVAVARTVNEFESADYADPNNPCDTNLLVTLRFMYYIIGITSVRNAK